MNLPKILLPALLALAALTSCEEERQSYAEMLRDENQAVNSFLADYPVINDLPADSVLQSVESLMADDPTLTRAEALKLTPFYRMDADGHVYMQVVKKGSGKRAANDQMIYFRFTRYNLIFVEESGTWTPMGNSGDLGTNTTSFRFRNTELASTTQWGTGIQVPLEWLDLDCEVRVVIKSYVGPTEELTSVYPYLYEVRYFPSRI